MKPKLLDFWRGVALDIALLSTCERTKVGALLLTPDGESLLAFGYNGGVRGGPNQPTEDVPGTEFWVHAEANALVKPRGLGDFIAIVTSTPCFRCAQLLLNSKVSQVYALHHYRDLAGWNLLQSHGKGEII